MIKFKQKEFFGPVLAAAGRMAATALPSLAVEGGLGLAANKSQEKTNQEQTEIMERQAEQQAEANRNIQRTLNKIAESVKKNPQGAAIATGQALQQRQFAKLGGKLTTFIKRDVGGFGKDVGKMILSKKNTLIGGTLAGGAMAGSSYLADKAVQYDMKKNGITTSDIQQQQKQYSRFSPIVKGIGRSIKEAAKENKGMILTTSTLGALPIVSGYLSDKQAINDQVRNTKISPESRSYSIGGSILKGIKGTKKSVINGFNTFKKHPGQSTLGFISKNIGQSGGRKEVSQFGKDLENLGNKSGSKISQKVGRFIYNNPKTSLIGSTVVGLGVTANTWDRGEKAVKNIAKKLDKNAYAYQESKDQMVEQ